MLADPLTATLTRSCASEEMARALAGSLAPDNEGYAEAQVEGAQLTIRVVAKELRELRRSLDDILACLATAEKTWIRASRIPNGTRSDRTPTP